MTGVTDGLIAVLRRRPITAFLLWFFTVGQLLVFLPVILNARGMEVPIGPFVVASNLVGLLLPAVVITWAVDGPDGLRRLRRQASKARVHIGWYALVAVVVPLMTLAAVAVAAGPPTGVDSSDMVRMFVIGFLLQTLLGCVTSNLWEEVGWTGFVQYRLQDRHGPLAAAALTAPLFALQHAALVVGSSVAASVVVLVALTLLAFPFRALLGWVGNRTGSLLLVGLVHAAGNAAGEGSWLGEGWLPRLYSDDSLGPVHIFALAVLGVVALIATRGRLGRARARAADGNRGAG